MGRAGWVARLAVIGVAVAAAFAGCASGPSDAEVASWPLATWEWDQGSAEDALLQGALALDDGCVYVGAGDATRVVPVFPRAYTSWDHDTQTLTFNGKTYAMGDTIAAGGGWHVPGESAMIPASCELDAYGEAMLIQDADITP